MNDFKPIALGQGNSGIGGTRHDFLITLNRHLARIQPNGGQQRRHSGTLGHLAGFSIHGNGDGGHGTNVAGQGRKGKRQTRLAPFGPPVLAQKTKSSHKGSAVTPPLIAVLNGPNLNMLGVREPEKYGTATLDDVEALCAEVADELGLAIDFRQTNSEGELVTWVQECRGRAAGIIMNPAGYTTTSIAVMDALLAVGVPVIEVHITNIHRREEFRHHSFISKAATGVICGLGVEGYALAIRAMAGLIAQDEEA